MAKNSWNDYSTTADNNTDIGGISMAEGMSPSSVNNCMREILAQTADVVAGNTTLTSLGITTGNITTGVFGDGAVGTPSITNSGDTNTGLYFSGADEISLTTGGTQRLSVDSSGHLNHNGSASADISALTSASSVAVDFDTAQNFSLTLAHDVTIANPTNANVGQTGSIFITQASSATHTVSFGSNWKFSGGTAPTATATNDAVDRLDYIVKSATEVHCVYTTNLS